MTPVLIEHLYRAGDHRAHKKCNSPKLTYRETNLIYKVVGQVRAPDLALPIAWPLPDINNDILADICHWVSNRYELLTGLCSPIITNHSQQKPI